MRNILLTCLVLLIFVSPLYAGEKVYVFAAASMTDAVNELVATYQKKSGTDAEFKTSYASSSTLARQIDAGAEVNVYISANMKWFKWLEDRNLIEEPSASILAANSLVLIAAPGNKARLESIEVLPQILGEGYLAMGDHTHVPAGMYAKEALDHYQLWDKLSKRLALYPSVRVALNAVEKAQADLGIVYKTDALKAPACRIVYTFDAASHTAIQYPVGAIRGKDTGETHAFLQFLKTGEAKKVLEKYGFIPL
jgi:molybdate transport system substrate-binding protein